MVVITSKLFEDRVLFFFTSFQELLRLEDQRGDTPWVMKPRTFPVASRGGFSCEAPELACTCNPGSGCQQLICIISLIFSLLCQSAH